MVQIAALVITLAISAAVTYATFSVHLAVVTTKLDYLTGRVAGLEAHIDKLDDRIDNLP
jgi:cell division protein FtsB